MLRVFVAGWVDFNGVDPDAMFLFEFGLGDFPRYGDKRNCLGLSKSYLTAGAGLGDGFLASAKVEVAATLEKTRPVMMAMEIARMGFLG